MVWVMYSVTTTLARYDPIMKYKMMNIYDNYIEILETGVLFNDFTDLNMCAFRTQAIRTGTLPAVEYWYKEGVFIDYKVSLYFKENSTCRYNSVLRS